MPNVSTPVKAHFRSKLRKAALEALERNGWNVSKASEFGTTRVCRITKNGVSKLAAIRTSQDTWIAFMRNKGNTKWTTLADVDVVVAASVDRALDPKFAQIHMIDANEMRDRFDRAYAARRAAGHSLPEGRGVWVSLYEEESTAPVSRVGAGAGIAHPPIVRVPLDEVDAPATSPPAAAETQRANASNAAEEPLTIAEAKARLARSLGVDPASIKITHPCPECKGAGRDTLTTFPVCERCYNMYSPHKAELPHWDDEGNPVNSFDEGV